MDKLLELQQLDLKIEGLLQRETSIPQQKNKFNIQRERLEHELDTSELRVKNLQLEQRQAEGEIEQRQTQIRKYDGQLLSIRKNEEYQALLHEIDMEKKQVALREERILNIMIELDEARDLLEEDRKRIATERAQIDAECAEIDAELEEAVKKRQELEAQRTQLCAQVNPGMYARYERIRKAKKSGPAVVPLMDEYCGGCHMKVLPQIVNEILDDKVHSCQHCGRLLYNPEKHSAYV